MLSSKEFIITDAAATKIIELLNSEKNTKVKFRLSVLGGGCSGFQYKYGFEEDINSNDILFQHNNAEVLIDDISLDLLKGSALDYVETLGNAGFEVRNPNATVRCGCGNSFGI